MKTDRLTNNYLTAFLLLLMTLLLISPLPAQAKGKKVKAPKMECHAYVLMDAGSGKVLFGQDENKKIYPASTAKLMNAIVCIENGDVDSKIKTSPDVIGHTTPGTYCLGLLSGVTFTFKDLLSLSLISSAADATDSLAVGVFGSKDACVEAMNAKCRELGLKKTSFDNPVGSDIGAGFNNTYSTATEMALITRYAMAMPLIRETVKKSHYETTSGQEIDANTTNWFIRGRASYSKNRYKIIGSKSGTTNAAGHVYIATATDKKGHEVICAYFGNVSQESTFASIRELLDYTFKQYDKGNLTLTGKCDDVRASDMRELFDSYAELECYPTSKDGRFYPNTAINRSQLIKMIKKADASYTGTTAFSNAALTAFADANKKGTVTAARAAELVQDLYPAHMNDGEIETVLADCRNTESLDPQEKEAYAIFVKSGILPDESCKNASQILTRKQAILLVDHLADYQVGYAARHPVGTGFGAVAAGAENLFIGNEASEAGQTAGTGPVVIWNYKWQKYYKELARQYQKEEKARIAAEEAAKAKLEAEEAAKASEAEAATATTAAPPEATTAAMKEAAPEATTAAK